MAANHLSEIPTCVGWDCGLGKVPMTGAEVMRAGADGMRFLSGSPVGEGWCPVKGGLECERKPGLSDMHEVCEQLLCKGGQQS